MESKEMDFSELYEELNKYTEYLTMLELSINDRFERIEKLLDERHH